MTVILQITWWNSPGLLPPFLYTTSIKSWRYRSPGNEAGTEHYITHTHTHTHTHTLTPWYAAHICLLHNCIPAD